MLRRIIGAMYFWSRNPQYLLLQWIVIVFSTLTVDVNSQSISGSVTITPPYTKPNNDVTLRCKFNLTKEQTTLLYWNDKAGDTLYFYEKGKNISLGPQYKNSVTNVKTNGGEHELTLRVTGCNNSPYKCDIWMDSTEHIIQESLVIELIAAPIVSSNNLQIAVMSIPDNSTYKVSCSVPEATMKHNLTMAVQINGNRTVSPAARDSSYNSTTCLHTCSLQKDYFLYTTDEVEIICTAHYLNGTKIVTRTTTPGMGARTMMEMSYIIIIVVIILVCIIIIIIIAIVMCVKKKKGWCWRSKNKKFCCCCMVDCDQEGKGPLKVNHDFQYSSQRDKVSDKKREAPVYEAPKLNEINENSNGEYQGLERDNEGVDYINVPPRSTEVIPSQHPRNNEQEWLDHPIPPQRPEKPSELNPLKLPSKFIPSGPASS